MSKLVTVVTSYILHVLSRFSLGSLSDFCLSLCSCCSLVILSHSLQCSFVCPHMPQWSHLPLYHSVCLPSFGPQHGLGLLKEPFHLLPIFFLFFVVGTFLSTFLNSVKANACFLKSISTWSSKELYSGGRHAKM